MANEPVEQTNATHDANLVDLARRLERGCSLEELRRLCLQVGTDADNLRHTTRSELARELVQYCDRRGRLDELEAALGQLLAERRDRLAEYRRRLLQETEFVELRGIPLPVDRDGRRRDPRVPLDKVYIHLQAVAEAEQRRQEEAEARRLAAEMAAGERAGAAPDFLGALRTLGEYFYRQGQVYQAAERPPPVDPQAALAEHQRLVVLGAPGAGKSTMLRYLARRAAEDEQGPLPVLVSLRDFAVAHAQDRQLSLHDFALQWAGAGDRKLQAALAAAAGAGQVLWLLDALDEARGLAGEAARQAAQLDGPLILTSRSVGYGAGPLQPLRHFEVLPLAPADVDQFLHDWFSILAADEAGQAEAVATRVAHLQAQLKERPRIQALGRNPLLLTFLVTLASQDPQAELPAQRAELYRRYVAELLAQREEGRRAQVEGAGDPVWQLGPLRDEAARRAALQGFYYLGWALHLNYYGGQSQAAPDEAALKQKLAAYFRQDGHPDPDNLAGAVFRFWQEAGMLDVWQIGGHSYLAFRHLTFQEYAAAWGLAEAWRRDPQRAWRFLFPRLHHYAWREPILLLAGVMEESHLNDLVRRLLRGRSPDERALHRDLRLAGALLAEGAPIEANIKHQILTRLLRLVTSSYPWPLQVLALYLGRTIANKEPIFELLGQIGDPATVPPLISALGDSDSDVRAAAAKALGWIGDAAAVPHLITALDDSDSTVRRSAAQALGQIGDAVPHLITALGDSDARVREWATQALGKTGKVAVPYLITDLGDSDGTVRALAALALGQTGEATAVPHLITALGDSSSGVRQSAAQALGQIGTADAVPHLIKALHDSEEFVRRYAAQALGQIGEAAAVPHLIKALGDSDTFVRVSATLALGQTGEAAVPPLITALNDSDSTVRTLAVQALGQIGDASAVPPLITVLSDSDEYVRRLAAEALGWIGDASAVPPLITALDDSDSTVRESAAKALGWIGGAAAVPHLISALDDSDSTVRESAARALGQIGEAAAVPHLITALGDSHSDERALAAEALGQFSPRTSDRLQLQQVKRALWWRLADTDGIAHLLYERTVAEIAFDALEQVVARLTVLEVAALPLQDPLLTVDSGEWGVGSDYSKFE